MMEYEQYNEFWNFIRLLHENDLLKHVILVGSWAEYLYAQSGLLKGFETNLRTLDIDFLIKNMRRPSKSTNLAAMIKDAGYTIEHDVLENTTKVYTPGLMEIEFLIAQKGSGENRVIQSNLGVNAQALRHMSVLLENVDTIEILGLTISVPSPEAYVAQKIAINKQRNDKAEKDRLSILSLYSYMNRDKFNKICNNMTKKEAKIINDFLLENELKVLF